MIRHSKAAFALVFLASLFSTTAQVVPQTTYAEAVHYAISLADHSRHLVHIKINIPPGAAERDLQLPVWNALYQVRDFSQYVNWVRARSPNGQALTIRQVDTSGWRVSSADNGAEIEYEIFADQPGPFGAQLNGHHGFFNLAEILMYPVDERASPVLVRFVDVPSGWRIATALVSSSGESLSGQSSPVEFSAGNYDLLVDAPVELGAFQERDFDAGGGHYRVVVDAEPADYDIQEIVPPLQHIVEAATTWMNDRPFQTYLFIYHFPRGPAGGGMEHAFSTAIDINSTRLAENPRALTDVTAHEFFHLWNVKRIRPQSLVPVDYTKENNTTALWFSEGMTTTASNIINLRAGILDEAQYLQGLASQIAMLEQRPAHLTQSVEESSLDAWLEMYDYYRRPERSISYYNKGFLVGVLLDLQIREASHGTASVRDVFLWMNQNYAQQGRPFPDSDGVEKAAEAVSHADLAWFFQKYVAGTEEIPWNDFFKSVGLRVIEQTATVADPGFVVSRNFDATPTVAAVTSGSDAERAGLAFGDAILEINGRLATADVAERLAELHPGDTIRLHIRNRQGEHELHWKLGSRQEIEFVFHDVDNPTPQQKARRAAWLKGESQEQGALEEGQARR